MKHEFRRACAAGAVIAAMLTGCGTLPAAVPGQPAAALGQPAAAHGSRAQAAALGRRMLAALVLPPGASALVRPLPRELRQPGELFGYGRYSVDLHKAFTLTQPMAVTQSFVARHVPTGMDLSHTGSGGDPVGDFVSFAWRKLPGGMYSADLVVAILPAVRGNGSLLRADAQVMWYPARSAAEFVRPGRFRAVTVSVYRYGQKSDIVRRTFTARSIIAEFARLINGLPGEPSVTFHCPAITVGRRVAFDPASSGQPPIVVYPTECIAVLVTVGGRAQPTLFGSAQLIRVIDHLVSYRRR
jgi:hypothetical protein